MEDVKPTQISVFNITAVICSAVFAVFSTDIVAAISRTIKIFAKPKPSSKVIELKKKISELKRELNLISPTGEFARYFKKERELNKATEELEVVEAEYTSETARNLKIETVVRVIMQFSALILLRYVSSITAYCIPDTIFWPFNILIRFPAIFGNNFCPTEFTEVSGFALAFLMIHLLNLLLKTVRKSDSPAGNGKQKN